MMAICLGVFCLFFVLICLFVFFTHLNVFIKKDDEKRTHIVVHIDPHPPYPVSSVNFSLRIITTNAAPWKSARVEKVNYTLISLESIGASSLCE